MLLVKISFRGLSKKEARGEGEHQRNNEEWKRNMEWRLNGDGEPLPPVALHLQYSGACLPMLGKVPVNSSYLWAQ